MYLCGRPGTCAGEKIEKALLRQVSLVPITVRCAVLQSAAPRRAGKRAKGIGRRSESINEHCTEPDERTEVQELLIMSQAIGLQGSAVYKWGP